MTLYRPWHSHVLISDKKHLLFASKMNSTGHFPASHHVIINPLTLYMVWYLSLSTVISRQSIRLYCGFTARKHMEAGLPTYRVKTTPLSWCTSSTCQSLACLSWSKQRHSKTKFFAVWTRLLPIIQSLALSKSPTSGFWQHSTVGCTCYRAGSCYMPSPASIIKPSAQTAWLSLGIASSILRLLWL